MILMEYCSHGNLKTYLVRKRREAAMFREGEKLIAIACQMAAGLSYLHSNSIAHKLVLSLSHTHTHSLSLSLSLSLSTHSLTHSHTLSNTHCSHCVCVCVCVCSDFAVRSCQVSDTETVKLGDYGLTRQVFEV